MIDPETNVGMAARLLKRYLAQFCQDFSSGKIPKTVQHRLPKGCSLSSFCCAPSCDNVFSEVPACLVEVMAAQWNYGSRPEGFDIWTVRNSQEDADWNGPVYQAWSMGSYTASSYVNAANKYDW